MRNKSRSLLTALPAFLLHYLGAPMCLAWHSRNKRLHQKLSHVRDKRARAILRRTIRHVFKKKKKNAWFRILLGNAQMRIYNPYLHSYRHTHKHVSIDDCIYLFTPSMASEKSHTRASTLFFSLGLDSSGFTCSTFVMWCLSIYRSHKYTRTVLIHGRT